MHISMCVNITSSLYTIEPIEPIVPDPASKQASKQATRQNTKLRQQKATMLISVPNHVSLTHHIKASTKYLKRHDPNPAPSTPTSTSTTPLHGRSPTPTASTTTTPGRPTTGPPARNATAS